jgi:molybdopterin synthase catalytic subunit
MLTLTNTAIDYVVLTESVRRPHCGAVSLFLGTVRDLTGEEQTVALEYEAYIPMAEAKMHEIVRDARQQWNFGEIAISHRLGRLEVGEIAVAVAVSSPHRAESFEVCRWVMERIKMLVPIWKKDHRPDSRFTRRSCGFASDRNAETGTAFRQ